MQKFENTNGLLRQYFPKGTDLSAHSQAYLNKVSAWRVGLIQEVRVGGSNCERAIQSIALIQIKVVRRVNSI